MRSIVPLRTLSAAPVAEIAAALSAAQTRAIRLLARGAVARVSPSVMRNLDRQGLARGGKLTTRGSAVADALTGTAGEVDVLADAMRRAFAHRLAIQAAELTAGGQPCDDDVVVDHLSRVLYVSHLLPAEDYAEAVALGVEAFEQRLAETAVG